MRNCIISLIILSIASASADQNYKHPYDLGINFNEDIPVVHKNNENSNNQAVTYYLRLVKYLLRKERFRSDPHDDNSFIASIPLRVTKDQYKMLIDADINGLNLHEIDDQVGEILLQSKEDQHSIPQILLDYYRQEIIGSMPSFSSPVFLSIIAVIVILLFNKIFHFSRLTYSAMIFMAIVAICAISYAMNYHDCMSDLEVEEIIKLQKENSPKNPCKDYHKEDTMAFIKSLWKSNEDACHDHLRKTLKASKKYCDPLDVFARWSAKIQMSYIGSITESFLNLLTQLTSSSNLMTKILIWVSSLIFFGFLIISIIKVTIASGFQGVFGFLSTSPAAPPKNESLEALSSKMDAILSENLEMKRELSIIRECSVERSIKSSPRVKRHKLSNMSAIKEGRVDSESSDS